MTVDDFIRTFKDIEVDIKYDRSRGLIEIDLPKINYMFYLFSYDHIKHMSDETAFYIAYALHKTLLLLESETCKKCETKMSGGEREQSNMNEEKKQKTGKWQWSFNGKAILLQCSECGLHYDSWAVGFNYCPNCGAKMEEEDNGKIC